MEISNQINNYQALSSYQQKKEPEVTLPVEPKDPKYTAGEIYEASNGNLISDKQGNISVTPQGQNNIDNAAQEKETQAAAAKQEQKDELRGVAVDYTAAQSKKSQVEIYLAVATDGEVEIGGNNDTASIIESLRDVQKQNNTIEAYATYKENQNSSQLGLIA